LFFSRRGKRIATFYGVRLRVRYEIPIIYYFFELGIAVRL